MNVKAFLLVFVCVIALSVPVYSSQRAVLIEGFTNTG
jgi:hypothetical protein